MTFYAGVDETFTRHGTAEMLYVYAISQSGSVTLPVEFSKYQRRNNNVATILQHTGVDVFGFHIDDSVLRGKHADDRLKISLDYLAQVCDEHAGAQIIADGQIGFTTWKDMNIIGQPGGDHSIPILKIADLVAYHLRGDVQKNAKKFGIPIYSSDSFD